MDKSKSEFEKAWSERKFVFGQTVSMKDIAEEFWNKSRERAVINLPSPTHEGQGGNLLNEGLVCEAIESIGIKVVIK